MGGREFRLSLPGRHNAINALAAIATARHVGLDDDTIEAGLASAEPPPMRFSSHRVRNVQVFNDAYNANPDSMAASLDSFADLAATAPRRVLVLGDMLELGAGSAELHREIGERIAELDGRAPLHHVVLVGDLSRHMADALAARRPATRLTRLAALDATSAASIASSLEPGDAVLLKGSRAMGLERVLDALAGAG